MLAGILYTAGVWMSRGAAVPQTSTNIMRNISSSIMRNISSEEAGACSAEDELKASLTKAK